MLAIYDDNPYPDGSLSAKIWDRNHKIRRLDTATAEDKYAIYRFIMNGSNLDKTARELNITEMTLRNKLQRYHII